MKKLIALLALAVANPLAAETLVSDNFPTNGVLNGQVPAIGGTWTSVSGTANEIQVVNNRVLLTDANSEDIQSGFAAVSTGNLYFGFDLSVADPGSYTGTDFEYFVHFDGSAGFKARTDIAAFSASGYRPGIATSAAAAEAVWGSDLAYGTDYRMIVGYDFITGLASMWIDPIDISDPSITSTTSETGFTLDGFNFRQSAASPDQALSIGALRVATTFDEVLIPEPSTYALLALAGAGFAAYRFRRRARR